MKPKKIIYLEKILRLMALAILKRHSPKIVAITGSVGKTSTKDAVFAVLQSKYVVRENKKNYNNEIGIPLTIIGAESGGRNLFGWVRVFLKWIYALVFTFDYPEILILELGIDHPGDMKYLMSFVKPYIGVVTNISLSHIEYFKTMDNIAKEKRVLIEELPKNGFAILNADDERTLAMVKKTSAKVITFGENKQAKINFSNFVYNYKDDKPDGISFKLNYDGANIPIRLRLMLAQHSVYTALAAISVGVALKINLIDIAKSLENLKLSSGRTTFFEGLKESYLLDDTYNASPKSTISALSILENLKAKRKIAVLGDMLELGDETENGHREVGKKLLEMKIDFFIATGKRMGFAIEEMLEGGYAKEKIIFCKSPLEAAQKVLNLIKKGDFILIKGSQGMRMEKVVEKLLANPKKDLESLCRQSKDWKNKPFSRP
jgi:UDP-N-acetylmuramoyl-tripeptide--D-alanyl-D-alanine ligase